MDQGDAHRQHIRNLERFIAENDDLFALESIVGRFNVFDALGAKKRELSHSNFLAWLLDPSESHHHGSLFLRAILMDLLKQGRPLSPGSPLSLLELDGNDLHDAQVLREWRNIDLLIVVPSIGLVVAVENKVKSSEHSNQLQRYKSIVNDRFPDMKRLFAFLTVDDDDATDEDWISYTYGDVHRVLYRARAQAAGSTESEVSIFLDHYLSLLERDMVSEGEVQRLCRQIYSNHKQAINLINKHAGGDAAPVLEAFEKAVGNRFPNVKVLPRTSKEVRLLPPGWKDALPPIGLSENHDAWLVLRMVVKRNRCMLGVRTLRVNDHDYARRNKILAALFDQSNKLGLSPSFKATWHDQKRVLLTTEQIATWKDDEDPDASSIADEAIDRLAILLDRLSSLPDVLHRAGASQ
ncbi:MAG: PD-(D/E)XK nuclease family protein [Phycisphaeraceae bacterium]|nr:PD-(D/E)XK nuclease family protein [Phycisphaeraceae bacterium]MBX3367807.1 PD-(D/E)XK nuclease family protein [Phycisphaeraceae bacterium]